MRSWRISLLIAVLSTVAALCPARAADDPAALFLQAYAACSKASELERAGQMEDALQKFRFARSLCEQIQRDFPNYQPIVIEYRLEESRKGISRVESMQAVATVSIPDPVSPARPQPPAARTPALGSLRIPLPSTPAVRPGVQTPPISLSSPGTVSRGTARAFEDEIRALRLKLQQSEDQVQELQQHLLEGQAREQSALTELDRTKVQVVELKSRLAQASQALSDAQVTAHEYESRQRSDAERIAGLESDLDNARADAEVAQEYNEELLAKLDRAAQFIDASEKIRTQLLSERQQLAATVNDDSKLAGVTNERDRAIEENRKLAAQLEEAASKGKNVASLQLELAAEKSRSKELERKDAERTKLETELLSQLEEANSRIADMRAQIEEGQSRFAELDEQLEQTSAATASVTGAMAAENALLKSLVTRQIKEQAKRQQARKLVEEEMEKLKVRSTTLLDGLHTLAHAETTLTTQEQKLFAEPVLAPAMQGSARGMNFELVVAKPEPALTSERELPEALTARAREASELSRANKLEEAQIIYQEIANQAPSSFMAAINLGDANHHLEHYPEAIREFRRALAIHPQDALALMKLGISQYRAGEIDAAAESLQQSLKTDATSHQAHYYLALALEQQGRSEAAKEELDRALALKPDYEPALEAKKTLVSRAENEPAATRLE